MSNYEAKIILILQKHNIPFEREKTFEDLKGGHLRFDFYLPNHNILLEVQGQQHFFQVKQFQKTEAEFKKAQEYDRRKISWSLSHGITLYCIPYWDIENIKTIFDILNPEYEAKTRWHNDKIWRKYNKNI